MLVAKEDVMEDALPMNSASSSSFAFTVLLSASKRLSRLATSPANGSR